EENFAKHTLFVLDVGRRFIKFSVIGLFILGTTAATAYECLHQYVEHVELAPEADRDICRWEWHLANEHWTGDPLRGGTDPSLGFKGRHIVRAAWMAYNWGVGYSTAVVNSGTTHKEGLPGPGGIRVIDAALQRTEDFLRSAVTIAQNKGITGSGNPHTLTDLLICHASVLERLGQSFQSEAKSQYERAWSGLSANGLNAAHVALKLGNINSRLGDAEMALAWWSRAILLSCGRQCQANENSTGVPALSDKAPSSPLAQRTLMSTFVSLSAFYATSGQLSNAQEVEESALNLIRSIQPPESLASATPAQALHALYLLHRSSLLSIHLAEVLHARKQPGINSIQWLTAAAESSERVAYALTGQPLDGFHKRGSETQAWKTTLLATYSKSRTMKKVAEGLLRDASRTAAEAWNLMGVLHEAREGPKSSKALQCYERAVEWAGTASSDSTAQEAASGTLEADWNVILSNYNRLK
ncbi:hypothetical protein AMATHDRAFT_118062, partial [Amanita thiersii Skay4041]